MNSGGLLPYLNDSLGGGGGGGGGASLIFNRLIGFLGGGGGDSSVGSINWNSPMYPYE